MSIYKGNTLLAGSSAPIQNQIGDISQLGTSDKSNLVKAINELQTLLGNGLRAIPTDLVVLFDGKTTDDNTYVDLAYPLSNYDFFIASFEYNGVYYYSAIFSTNVLSLLLQTQDYVQFNIQGQGSSQMRYFRFNKNKQFTTAYITRIYGFNLTI